MQGFQPLQPAKIFSSKPGETELNLSRLRFPLWGSIKYDGIRLFEYQGEATTRSLNPPRNHHVRKLLRETYELAQGYGLTGLDGEAMAGAEDDWNAMQNSSSGIMSFDGTPELNFRAFDTYQDAHASYESRYARFKSFVEQAAIPWLKIAEQVELKTLEALLEFEHKCTNELKLEGIMVRRPDAPYKFGRSTMVDQTVMALKRFVDDEAVIIGFEPEMENTNVAEKDNYGRTKRSGHAEGMIPKNRMGRMICRSPKFEKSFGIGGGRGMTHALRQEIWDNQEKYLRKIVVYTYQEIGVKERPRLPKYKAFRDPLDIADDAMMALRRLGA